MSRMVQATVAGDVLEGEEIRAFLQAARIEALTEPDDPVAD